VLKIDKYAKVLYNSVYICTTQGTISGKGVNGMKWHYSVQDGDVVLINERNANDFGGSLFLTVKLRKGVYSVTNYNGQSFPFPADIIRYIRTSKNRVWWKVDSVHHALPLPQSGRAMYVLDDVSKTEAKSLEALFISYP